MWLIALALLADTVHTFSLALSPAESVAVTVTGTGDPVVLVPGLFGSAFGYRALIPLLTDAGYRAIVVEPLGIGSSARPAHADYSLTAQADRIAAALDRLSVRRAIVVAHSLGASMAFRLAYRRPELVAGIVSLDGGRRARPGRDAQGVPRNGGAARAGAVAATSRRGAVPRPPAPRNGDARGRGQRGGSSGPGRRAPGVRRGQRGRGRALHLRGAACRGGRGGATGAGVVGSVASGLDGWLQFPAP